MRAATFDVMSAGIGDAYTVWSGVVARLASLANVETLSAEMHDLFKHEFVFAGLLDQHIGSPDPRVHKYVNSRTEILHSATEAVRKAAVIEKLSRHAFTTISDARATLVAAVFLLQKNDSSFKQPFRDHIKALFDLVQALYEAAVKKIYSEPIDAIKKEISETRI